jgi:hypothetical protein
MVGAAAGWWNHHEDGHEYDVRQEAANQAHGQLTAAQEQRDAAGQSLGLACIRILRAEVEHGSVPEDVNVDRLADASGHPCGEQTAPIRNAWDALGRLKSAEHAAAQADDRVGEVVHDLGTMDELQMGASIGAVGGALAASIVVALTSVQQWDECERSQWQYNPKGWSTAQD